MEVKKKTKSDKIFEFFVNSVKSADIFDTDIKLNYKGQSSFKTMIGGTTSIFICIGISFYNLPIYPKIRK